MQYSKKNKLIFKKIDMEVGLAKQRKKERERRNKKGANGRHKQRRRREEKVRCEGTISCKVSFMVIL
jgi:hypothetical protein